jgi:hypothetical protein
MVPFRVEVMARHKEAATLGLSSPDSISFLDHFHSDRQEIRVILVGNSLSCLGTAPISRLFSRSASPLQLSSRMRGMSRNSVPFFLLVSMTQEDAWPHSSVPVNLQNLRPRYDPNGHD